MTRFNDHIRRTLPAIFLVGLIFFLPSCRYLKQHLNLGEYSLESAIKWAKADSTRVADSLKRVMADKKHFEEILTDSLMGIRDDDLSPVTPDSGYYIIAGSFTSHDNAMDKIKLYNAQGHKATIIDATGRDGTKLELVSVKTFKDHNEATVFLQQFRSEHDPGAWIYVRQ